MQLREPAANEIISLEYLRYLKCEHCGGGETMTSKPVPAVILPTLVCRDCRKDASGTVVPVLELPV